MAVGVGVWVREPECRGAWVALRANQMGAGRLPRTLRLSLLANLLEFLEALRVQKFADTQFLRWGPGVQTRGRETLVRGVRSLRC